MSLASYSRIELLSNQVKALEYVAKNLESCCNVQMQCRQDVYDETHRQIKIAKIMLLAAQIKDALINEDSVFYFDLDGIIFNWRKRILEEYPQFKTIDEFNKFEGRDKLIQEAYEKHPDWFLKLEWMRSSIARIELLVDIGVEVRFLTATGSWGDPEHSRTMKREALAIFLHENDIYVGPSLKAKMDFVEHSADKAQYAKSKHHVLFDDYAKNVNEWRAAGGTAVLIDTERYEEEKAWEVYDTVVGKEAQDLERYISW